jgi:hypothetical protein
MKAMKGRIFWVLSLLMAVLLIGCGSGDLASNGDSTDDNGRGSVSGYLFTASDGSLVLHRTAAPPAGATAARGVLVEVPGQGSVRTGDNGSFTLTNLLTGITTLKTGSLSVPLTVIADSTIQLGDPPVTRAMAIEEVRRALQMEIMPGQKIDIFALVQPLPIGTAINSALSTDAPLHRTVREQWFVYVDLEPGPRFSHPVLYYLVDTETAALTKIEADSWPTLNGYSYYRVDGPLTGIPDVVEMAERQGRSLNMQAETTEGREPVIRLPGTHGRADEDGKTYLMTVVGDSREDFMADPPRIPALLTRMGLPPIAVREEVRPWIYGKNASSALISRFNSLASKTRSGDTFIFYLTTHGTFARMGVNYGPKTYSFSLQTEKPLPKNDPEYWGKYYKNILFSPFNLNFSLCKACRIIIIVDTCYSGNWVPMMMPRLEALSGKEVVLMTAADESKTATGINNQQSVTIDDKQVIVPIGGLFTNALIHVFNGTVSGSTLYEKMNTGYTKAANYTKAVNNIEKRSYQNPLYWSRTLKPDEKCESGSQIIDIK